MRMPFNNRFWIKTAVLLAAAAATPVFRLFAEGDALVVGIENRHAVAAIPENYNGAYAGDAGELGERLEELIRDQDVKFLQFNTSGLGDDNLKKFLSFCKKNSIEPLPIIPAYAPPYDFNIEDQKFWGKDWPVIKDIARGVTTFLKACPDVKRFVYDCGPAYNWTYTTRFKVLSVILEKVMPGVQAISSSAAPGTRENGDVLWHYGWFGDATVMEWLDVDFRFVGGGHKRWDGFARFGEHSRPDKPPVKVLATHLRSSYPRGARNRGTEMLDQLMRVSLMRNGDIAVGESVKLTEMSPWALAARKFLLNEPRTSVLKTKLPKDVEAEWTLSWAAAYDAKSKEIVITAISQNDTPRKFDFRFTSALPKGEAVMLSLGEDERNGISTNRLEFAGGKRFMAEAPAHGVVIWRLKAAKPIKVVKPKPKKPDAPDGAPPGRMKPSSIKPPKQTFPAMATNYDFSKLKLENLGRGVVAWRMSEKETRISWRYKMKDPRDIAFDVYRDGKKINKKPIGGATYFTDAYHPGATYRVLRVKDGKALKAEKGSKWTVPADAPIGYIRIQLNRPEGGEVKPPCFNAGEKYEYLPEDCSVGDADGDGEYELFIKWAPTNGRDNAHMGGTGPTLFECVKISTGKSLWRINLGTNIRSGSHYLPFMVYDFDGDGSAELICRSSDGTVDGKGKVWGDAEKDWREESGQVIFAPLYTTVFSGRTGEILDRDQWPDVFNEDWRCCRGWLNGWFDLHDRDGNRPFRFLSAIAYLDGVHPSVVMCRGYYTRTILHAYDWDGKKLKTRWRFDTHKDKNPTFGGQGFHNLRVGDVDFDGKDEVIYGQMVVDDDGKGLYSTGIGHGDAINLIQLAPDRPGLQVWTCQENGVDGAVMREAGTGEIIFQIKSHRDVPRAVAADVDGEDYGTEFWAASAIGLYNTEGRFISWAAISPSFMVWWTGDLCRSGYGGSHIANFFSRIGRGWAIADMSGTWANHGSKCVPCMSGDIFGDWREEVVQREDGDNAVRIYLSAEPSKYRFWTFMEDPVYRISVGTQNNGYNQPPQPGFYFGPDLKGHGIWFRGQYIK